MTEYNPKDFLEDDEDEEDVFEDDGHDEGAIPDPE
jgi:hypothetical protein|tara:strand:- start:745 stop:849 length:105 start_codon:yes stop_codon:yes gene_type:complete